MLKEKVVAAALFEAEVERVTQGQDKPLLGFSQLQRGGVVCWGWCCNGRRCQGLRLLQLLHDF